jgi:hypothetical protein
MNASTLAPGGHSAFATTQDGSLQHLPAGARAALEQFQEDGNLSSLDPVVLAILEDSIPGGSGVQLADLPGETRLIDDLGLPPSVIEQAAFFAGDLFGLRISNEEILSVLTLDDLRSFIHRKVALRPVR